MLSETTRPAHLVRVHLSSLLLLLLACITAPVEAGAGGTQEAETFTHQLVGLSIRLQNADLTTRDSLLEELRLLATERRALLAELIEQNPGEVLRVALPESARAGMPPEVKSLLEQRRTLEGELEVVDEDYRDGSHRLRHFLKTSDERVALYFKQSPPGLVSGTTVRADGILLGDAMALTSGENLLILAADGSTTTTTSTITSNTTDVLPNTFGEQRTAVLLVNFPTAPSEPWTTEEVRSVVFGQVSDFFRENSYGQTWLSGDVFGWFTVPVDPAGCATLDITIEAKRAAAARGIDLSGYDRLLFGFPEIGCSWSGEATVGGSPSLAWFDGTLTSARIVSHELGHNFGLFHSHAMACAGEPPLSDGCIAVEYGDVLDRMGNTSGGHFNAFQKARLGWLDFGSSPSIATADTSGRYRLEPFSVQSNGVKALRVRRDTTSTGEQRWYYLEARQAQGFDGFLSTSRYGASAANGLLVRLGTDANPNSSFLLDMTPGSQYYDWDDLALPLGASYTDPVSGVTITLEAVDEGGATVNVSVGGSSCTHALPGIAISPAEGPWVPAGTGVTYAVTVTNNDSAACGGAAFDLAATVPAGWVGRFGDPSLNLVPGASATTDLTVVSAQEAADGFYDLGIIAAHGSGSVSTGSVTATYVISATTAPANEPPVAVDDNVVMAEVGPITLDVLANDYDTDGDAIWVTAVSQGKKGTVELNADGTVTYLPGSRFNNGDSFTYEVSDGTETVTAVVTVSSEASSTDNKGQGGGKGRLKNAR